MVARLTERVDEKIYRTHNVVEVSKKIVPDLEGRPQVSSRPNEAHQQCQCDNCRAHRRRNSVTGVAGPNRSV